jgi:hypothetical protein
MSFEDEKWSKSADLETHLKEQPLETTQVSIFLSSLASFRLTHTGVHAQQRYVVDEYDDPNIDPTAIELEDESPYPEVRSAVANTDDPTMPASTFRAWVVGLMWAILIPGVNQFFFFRYPSVTISSVCPSVIVSVNFC